jgi:hypothetical protein
VTGVQTCALPIFHPGQAHIFKLRTDERSPLRGILGGKIRRKLAV